MDSQGIVLPPVCWAFLNFRLLRAPHVNSGSVHHVLDVGCVKFLDHLDAGAAVLRDLIHVGAFREPHADIGMPQTVERPPLALVVELEVKLTKDRVEKVVM